MADHIKKPQTELAEKIAVLSVENASMTKIEELQLLLANVNVYIARLRFRREIGLPPEPLTGEELRGKGRNL